MKIYKFLVVFILAGGLFTSCSKDNNDMVDPPKTGELPGEEVNIELEIKDFMYKGMNEIYLYKSDVVVLSDDYFSDQEELNTYLEGFSTPEDLYYDGLVASQDRFSFLTDDYVELENNFAGTSKSTGIDYGLSLYASGSNNVFGYVRYVVNGSPADAAGIERGMVFTKINGQQLTRNNFRELLAPETLTFEFADIDGGNFTLNGESATVTKVTLTENPILVAKTLDVDGRKVGYLMYNSFVANFDDELNDAFGMFKSEGIQDLVLDLRYNGGGRVSSAIRLSSMITGQFTGEVFSLEEWNAKYQAFFESENPERLVNRFVDEIDNGVAINSLNLNRLYVIGTGSTASASELVINSLRPYIDVIHVGTTTVGKFQASVTLYDSPNFGRDGANPNHTYAIQPLVLKSVNANGEADFLNG